MAHRSVATIDAVRILVPRRRVGARSSPRSRQLATPMSADGAPGSLSIGRLKSELGRLGVPHSDCIERSDLVARLAEARELHGRSTTTERPTGRSTPSPAPRESADVQRVLACLPHAHYAVLDVPHAADADALKKAYRTLALKLHPDKCPAPGADEAFKRVSTAFAVLSDPRQRAAHRFSCDASGAPPGGQPSSPFVDVDAEALFRAVFGSGAFDGFGGGAAGTAAAGGGGGKSASLARADAELVRIFGPTVASWMAVSRRLGETFYQNPWALVTALMALLSAVSVLETAVTRFGTWAFLALPGCGLAVWRCAPQQRRTLAFLVMSVLMSGIIL